MARIQTYPLDKKITRNDIWIGSDGDMFNKTKNFSPNKLSEYFNTSEEIYKPNAISFKYQTIELGEEREAGTISFKNSNPATINFSQIFNLMVSKISLGLKYVDGYLQNLTDCSIIIHKGRTVNNYGVYKVLSIIEDIDEPNFFNIQLSFIQGNNGLEEDEEYVLSVVDFNISNSSNETFIFNQSVASQVWEVQHNLSKFPSVTISLPTGQVGYGDVAYIDENNLTITFAGDESGKAYIN
jgi:hypothetical protein